MRYTGTLEFTDIGAGSWYLVTDACKYRISIANEYATFVKSFKSALTAGATISVEADPVEELSTANTLAPVISVRDVTSILYI